jgi:hypothetical protein
VQVPLVQVPWQRPPQPSASPQAAPAGQFGAHAWQVPWMQSGFALGQAAPQSPPHPSEPQSLAMQSGVQVLPHAPAEQVPLAPQLLPQVPQLVESLPRATQVLAQQVRPFKQGPEHLPPQPSPSPQCLPVQTGAHTLAASAPPVPGPPSAAAPPVEIPPVLEVPPAGPVPPVGVVLPAAPPVPGMPPALEMPPVGSVPPPMEEAPPVARMPPVLWFPPVL